MNNLHIFDHLLVFLLGVVIPWRTIASQKMLKTISFSTSMKIQLYWSNSFGLWLMAILVGALWLASGRSFSELGLWPLFPALPYRALVWTLVFLALYLLDVYFEVGITERRLRTRERWRQELSFLPENHLEYRHFILLCLSAGICEEIVFRGFFISYFLTLLEPFGLPTWFAVVLPALLFGLVHYYQGWKSVVKIVIMAVIFGLIFLWSGSLWWLILLHIVVDLIGGGMSWALHKGRPDVK